MARSDHSHGLVCVPRTATGGDDAVPRVAGVAFQPTGPSTESGGVNTGGPGYRCRDSNGAIASTPLPTAYAICCRLP